MKRRKFKHGQLFTHNGHVYQVRKTPDGFLSCDYCKLINNCKYRCIAPCFDCAELIPAFTYLKQIK